MSPYRSPEDALGAMLATHRWTLSPALLVIGVFFLSPPLAVLVLPMGEDWNVMSYVGAALGLVGMPLMGVAILVSAFRLRANRVDVHEHGLVHVWQGRTTRARYEDVVGITSAISQETVNGVPGPVVHRHDVAIERGEPLVITNGFADVEALIAQLERRTARTRRERIEAQIRAGDSAAFGPLLLSATHLEHIGHEPLPRSELTELVLEDGMLRVMRDGTTRPYAVVPAAKVTNLDLLLALAR